MTRAARGSRRCAPHSAAILWPADSHLSGSSDCPVDLQGRQPLSRRAWSMTPPRDGDVQGPQRRRSTQMTARRNDRDSEEIFLGSGGDCPLWHRRRRRIRPAPRGQVRDAETSSFFSCGRRVTRRFPDCRVPGDPEPTHRGLPRLQLRLRRGRRRGMGHRRKAAIRHNARRLLHRVRQLRRRGHERNRRRAASNHILVNRARTEAEGVGKEADEFLVHAWRSSIKSGVASEAEGSAICQRPSPAGTKPWRG